MVMSKYYLNIQENVLVDIHIYRERGERGEKREGEREREEGGINSTNIFYYNFLV